MMQTRMKQHPDLYPKWKRKRSSPAQLCKERDGKQCVDCKRGHRTNYTNVQGEPSMIFLHAGHVHPLDPDYQLVEPIEGQRLRARCPQCHAIYDGFWKARQAELDHQITMHNILLHRFYMQRFMQVV